MLRGESDADAGVGLHVQPVEHHGLLEGFDQCNRGLHRPPGTDARQKQGEFVAAQPGQDVSVAQRSAQPGGDPTQ